MSLQDLPPELTESVVLLLSLADICSLRLASKRLASNTAQKHFKAKFRTKRLELTEQQLRSFVAVTAHGGLGCQLQDLTFVAPVYNTTTLTARLESKTAQCADLDEKGRLRGRCVRKRLTDGELRQAGLDLVVLQERLAEQFDMIQHRRNVTLLSQAFCNLAAHGVSLRVLQTEVQIYKDDTTMPLLPLFGGHWKPIWAATARASYTIFTSLADCDLPIDILDIFSSARMVRCSLSCNELNGIDLASGRLNGSLGLLTSLSMRISDHGVSQISENHSSADESSDEGRSVEITQPSNFDGLRSLLQTCSSLQKLDLTHFSLESVDRGSTRGHAVLQVLSEVNLPRLRSLTLQGFRTTGSELLTLVQGFKTLRSLSLAHMKLIEGTFRPVLNHCTVEAKMEEVELDTLFESDFIQFERPWVLEGTSTTSVFQGCLRSRASYRRPLDNAAKRHIRHYLRRSQTYDSPGRRAWSQDIKNRFGPLQKNGKPSWLQPHVSSLEQTWQY
jgi:hypothetical protein